MVIIDGNPNDDVPDVRNVDEHFDGSVDSLNYDSECDEEAEGGDNNVTIDNDNDSNGSRGATGKLLK